MPKKQHRRYANYTGGGRKSPIGLAAFLELVNRLVWLYNVKPQRDKYVNLSVIRIMNFL
jgi:hypothetical protein